MHAALLELPAVLTAAKGLPHERRARIEPGESDADLVRRARGGDRWAEEALYHRHVRAVARTALRLLARSAEAEDVVQDAFVIAFGDLERLRDEDSFGPWLLRIAVRQVHRRFRKRRLLRAFGLDRGDDDVALADQADTRAGPDVVAALSEIDAVLRRLPPRCRMAWVLRRVEEHELRDVSTMLDCSLATTKRLVQRAEALISAHVGLEPRGGADE
jgi:RNA polymerase sigma-70 factor (ECF subfamily)